MKTLTQRLYVSVVLGGLTLCMSGALTSCSIDPNMNNSPNAISENNILTQEGQLALLVGLQASGAGDFYSGDRSRIGSMWTWQLCAPGTGRPQATQWDSYLLTSDGPPDQMWKGAYYSIKQANDIINNADNVFGAQQKPIANTVVGMAEWYKALCLGEIAAYFGDAPIVQSVTDPTAPPTFVPQAEVYNEVQRLLADALTRFAGGSDKLTRDLNYGGNNAKWIAATHSLRARYFLHVKDYGQAYSEASQGITDSLNNLYAFYDASTAGGYSPWGHWTNDESGTPIRAEKTFVDSLKSEPGDTRLAKYFTAEAPGGVIVGFADHGEANADSNETVPDRAAIMKLYGGYGDPFPYITSDEVTLIKAECEARGQGGNAAAAVTDVNLIRRSAGLADFASSDPSVILKEVLKQKWLQLFAQGQAYNDMRRTPEFPLWEKVPGKNLRIIYPKSEKETNPNVPTDDDSRVKTLLGIL